MERQNDKEPYRRMKKTIGWMRNEWKVIKMERKDSQRNEKKNKWSR